MSRPDGGPAFPGKGTEIVEGWEAINGGPLNETRQLMEVSYKGMSLRAYLDGKALAAMHLKGAGGYGALDPSMEQCVKWNAQAAVAQADALIAELEKS